MTNVKKIQQNTERRRPTREEVVRAAAAANTIAELGNVWPMIHAFNLYKADPVDFNPMMEKRRKEIAASLDAQPITTRIPAFSNREKALDEAEQRWHSMSREEQAREMAAEALHSYYPVNPTLS